METLISKLVDENNNDCFSIEEISTIFKMQENHCSTEIFFDEFKQRYVNEEVNKFFNNYLKMFQIKTRSAKEILDKTTFSSKIKDEVVNSIKLLHVFDDVDGQNILFINEKDQVYGLGSNYFGCCGLGHNNLVNEPHLIPELCHKKIQQFFIGWSFTLASTSENVLYGWGDNCIGELAKQSQDDHKLLKPAIISSFNEEISKLSCGSLHCLVLTKGGDVYGWGNNSFGQIGCGKEKGEIICKPYHLQIFAKYVIKDIYCSFLRSVALTCDGLVFTWGSNHFHHLGHETYCVDHIYTPQLVDISRIVSICLSSVNIYFLNTDGLVYYCGYYEDKNYVTSLQQSPKLLNDEMKFESLYSIDMNQTGLSIASGISRNSIIHLDHNYNFTRTEKNIFNYYLNEYKITFKTTEVNMNDNNNKYFDPNFRNNFPKSLKTYDFDERYIPIKEFTRGDFYSVHKTLDINIQKEFVIKRIHLKGKINLLILIINIQ